MPEPVRAFLSATGRGLRSVRTAAADFLRGRGVAPVVQEEFDCDYQEIRRLLRDQLAPCDAVVLLVGPAYGCQPLDGPDHLPRRSYTQREYDLAVELKKPVYRILAYARCPLDPFPDEPAEHRRLQQEHVAALKQGDNVRYEFDSLVALLRLLGKTRFHRAVRPNLPYARVGGLFKGRDEVLARVRRPLVSRPAHAAAVTARPAIHGLGGVGKTRLALEYAFRYASEYSARLYVTADSPFSLGANLAALCRADGLDLPEKDAREQDVPVEAVHQGGPGRPEGYSVNVDNRAKAERPTGTAHWYIGSGTNRDRWPGRPVAAEDGKWNLVEVTNPGRRVVTRVNGTVATDHENVRTTYRGETIDGHVPVGRIGLKYDFRSNGSPVEIARVDVRELK